MVGGRKIKKKFKDILNRTVAFKYSLGCMNETLIQKHQPKSQRQEEWKKEGGNQRSGCRRSALDIEVKTELGCS